MDSLTCWHRQHVSSGWPLTAAVVQLAQLGVQVQKGGPAHAYTNPYRRPSSADTIRLRFPRPTSVTAAGVPSRRLACAPAGHGGTTCLPSAAREDDSERGGT